MKTQDAARAWVSGAMKALPRVVGAEKPSVMLRTPTMAGLLRAAFEAGAEWEEAETLQRSQREE